MCTFEFVPDLRPAKFLRRCQAELVAHVGGPPSFAQKLLIRRAARAMLRLELFDARMSSGDWTDHDARTLGGLNNALPLALRELGVRETKPKPRLAAYSDSTLNPGVVVPGRLRGDRRREKLGNREERRTYSPLLYLIGSVSPDFSNYGVHRGGESAKLVVLSKA
jgi:hypothetical protein